MSYFNTIYTDFLSKELFVLSNCIKSEENCNYLIKSLFIETSELISKHPFKFQLAHRNVYLHFYTKKKKIESKTYRAKNFGFGLQWSECSFILRKISHKK